MSYVIQVEELVKSYNSNTVLNGLSFNVVKGEIFALLGVNGSGKTTTLECIEGLRKYDSGRIVVNGKMGIQLQAASLPENIKGMEAVKLFAKWNKVELNYSMLNSLGINEIGKKQYLEMSTGQKRRLHLAIALVRNPDIVFLDEPTAGLDVEGRMYLHKEIRKLQKEGKTIIMASHDMTEVETMCDRIAILKDGKIGFIGTAEELTAKVGHRCMIHIKTEQGDHSFESSNISETLITQLEEYKRQEIKVLDVKIDRGSLEEHFIDISRGNKE